MAETSAEGTEATAALVEMLGPDARRVDPPSSVTDPDALLAWALEPDVAFGAIVALDVRRIFVVIPSQQRTLERVLPAEVSSEDGYAVALAASELLELAQWGHDAEPSPSLDDEAPPTATPPPAEEPDLEAPVHDEPRVRYGISIGAQGWVGVPLELAEVDGRIAFEATFMRLDWGGAHPFAEIAVAGLGRDTKRSVVAGAPFELSYAREELGVRFGLGYAWRRLEMRPFAALALEWVRVRATSRAAEATKVSGSDDRAAAAFGLGLEARVNLGDHFFVAASLAAEALLGRTPYGALGERVLEEPWGRVIGRLGLGVQFPVR